MGATIKAGDARFPMVKRHEMINLAFEAFVTYRMAIAEQRGANTVRAGESAAAMWQEFGDEHRTAWIEATKSIYASLAKAAGCKIDPIPE